MSPILLAGVDEAGRGPLVGSVFAAAVILPERYDLHGLTDSKKLSEKKRDALAVLIKEQVVSWSVASASPEEIAELNILHATMLAMTRAVQGLAVMPDKVLIDGNRVPKDLGISAEAVVKGDSKPTAWKKCARRSPPSSPKPRAMPKCTRLPNVIRNTVSTKTKATAQRNTSPPCKNTVCCPNTAAISHP